MEKMSNIKDKGFSLVELIIVVAIITVLGAVAATGMSLLTSRPVDECAKKIQIALEGNRSTTMGKYSGYLEFTADSDGIYVEEFINGTSQGKLKIGQSGVDVSVSTKVPAEAVPTSSSLGATPFRVEFDRSDGSLKKQADDSYLVSFEISRGSRVMIVTVDRLTGRVDLE